MTSTHQPVDTTTARGLLAPGSSADEQASIPCVYCRSPIRACTFAFWSNARRLVSATCPECDRRVILTTALWRRRLEGVPA